MIFDPGGPTVLIASQLAHYSAGDPRAAGSAYVLSTIDQILSMAAVAFVVGIGVWWLARPERAALGDAPPRPNRLGEDSIALAVIVYLLAALLLTGLVSLVTGGSESLLATLFVGNGAQLAGITICLLIAAERFDGGVGRFWFGQPAKGAGFKMLLTGLVALVAIGLCPVIRDATVSLVCYFVPDFQFAPHTTIKALQDPAQPIGVVAALWVGAAVIAPVAEESFFRGLLQTFLVGVLRNRWLAIALASIAFGLVHFPQPHAVGALVVLGILIGYVYERTGSLALAVVIHAAFNLKTLVWVSLGEPLL